jgi:hypothetical protein
MGVAMLLGRAAPTPPPDGLHDAVNNPMKATPRPDALFDHRNGRKKAKLIALDTIKKAAFNPSIRGAIWVLGQGLLRYTILAITS